MRSLMEQSVGIKYKNKELQSDTYIDFFFALNQANRIFNISTGSV